MDRIVTIADYKLTQFITLIANLVAADESYQTAVIGLVCKPNGRTGINDVNPECT